MTLHIPHNYRVFIKYRVFSNNAGKFASSPSPALGCHWLFNKLPGVTVHSHCVESFEGLLQRCRLGSGYVGLWKNTIFPEHPVQPDDINYLGSDGTHPSPSQPTRLPHVQAEQKKEKTKKRWTQQKDFLAGEKLSPWLIERLSGQRQLDSCY